MRDVFTWQEIKNHLEGELSRVLDRLLDADPADVPRLQGEGRAIKRLLKLPETLALKASGKP